MIIDFHTHCFPAKIAAAAIAGLSARSHTLPFTDGTEEDLLRSMDEAGVDLSVILPVATAARQVPHINDAAHRLNLTRGGKSLLSLAAMHPDYPDWETELERIAALGLRGIKIHPVYQGVDLDDERYLRIFRRCGELGLLVVTHAGLDIGYPGVVHCSPEMARHAWEAAGPFSFVLAHMGGWREWERVAALLADTGVWLDTAFSTGALAIAEEGAFSPEEREMMGEAEFLGLVRAFGAERILFGTDSPWSEQRSALTWMRSAALSETEREMILGGNAARLLGLEAEA